MGGMGGHSSQRKPSPEVQQTPVTLDQLHNGNVTIPVEVKRLQKNMQGVRRSWWQSWLSQKVLDM